VSLTTRDQRAAYPDGLVMTHVRVGASERGDHAFERDAGCQCHFAGRVNLGRHGTHAGLLSFDKAKALPRPTSRQRMAVDGFSA
jgi:hypothetical protein